MAAPDMSGYVEVAERIEAFHEKYPEGSLQGVHSFQKVGEQLFVIFVAQAYRTPDDPRPGVGHAWEPFPGKTNFTRDSELQNAETSGWGRALAALGFKVKDGIASANEVAARQGNDKPGDRSGPISPSDKQVAFLLGLAEKAGFIGAEPAQLEKWAKAKLTGGKEGTCSEAINGLKDKDKKKRVETADRIGRAMKEWAKEQDKPPIESDLPEPDIEGMGLEPVDDPAGEAVIF